MWRVIQSATKPFANKFLHCLTLKINVDVLLTVHLSIILVINRLHAQNLVL